LTDRTHGLQFKADVLRTTPPTTTEEGIARYLGSGMVRGIGPKLAERIVGQFGLETFEVIPRVRRAAFPAFAAPRIIRAH
jgi:exodeoxyribonuclease V alpha subunit